MPCSREISLAWLSVVAVLASTSPGLAAPAPEARVEYEGPPECGAPDAFLGKLAARSPGVRVSDDPAAAREGPTVVVRVSRGPRPGAAAVHGELRVAYTDGTDATRSVDGDTCDSVASALALMAAMALERVTPPSERPAPPPEEPDAVRAEVDVDRAAGMHVAVGAGGGAVFGIAPVASPDGSGFVEVLSTSASVWSPSLRMGVDVAASGDAAVAGGGVEMTRAAALIDGCPLRVVAGPLRFTPCVHLEGGGLAASGVGVTPDRSALRPWVAAGLSGSLRYVAFRRLFLELSGGARAPLVRDHFFFEPDTVVFEAPVVSGFVGAGVGVTIL